MTSPVGNNTSHSNEEPGRQSGFTLIELIIVMAMLLIVLAVAAPSLKNFFKGRNLDSEARRFLALTRYGQSRAVSEGVPMVLWMNTQSNTYGLNPAPGYRVDYRMTAPERQETDIAFKLPEGMELKIENSGTGTGIFPTEMMGLPGMTERRIGDRGASAPGQVEIRFLPEGFPDEWSPRLVSFAEGEERPLWIGLGRDQRRYEVQTQPTLYLAR